MENVFINNLHWVKVLDEKIENNNNEMNNAAIEEAVGFKVEFADPKKEHAKIAIINYDSLKAFIVSENKSCDLKVPESTMKNGLLMAKHSITNLMNLSQVVTKINEEPVKIVTMGDILNEKFGSKVTAYNMDKFMGFLEEKNITIPKNMNIYEYFQLRFKLPRLEDLDLNTKGYIINPFSDWFVPEEILDVMFSLNYNGRFAEFKDNNYLNIEAIKLIEKNQKLFVEEHQLHVDKILQEIGKERREKVKNIHDNYPEGFKEL